MLNPIDQSALFTSAQCRTNRFQASRRRRFFYLRNPWQSCEVTPVQDGQSPAQSAAQSPGQSFGDLLRARREFVYMSVSELARRTGLSRGTIRNLESGRTAPTPDTVHRLSSVFELALPTKDQPREGRFAPSAWLSPRYDPLKLASDMAQVFNGPGGTLEQTFAYLDPQSAAASAATTCPSSPQSWTISAGAASIPPPTAPPPSTWRFCFCRRNKGLI